MSTTRHSRPIRRSFVISSSRCAGRPAASMAAGCTRSCAIGTRIVPSGNSAERDFAAAWRSQRKWVVSRSLKSVGPNATLVADDLEPVIGRLKAELVGEIERWRTGAGAKPDRSWSRRRVSALSPSRRAWPREAVLRRPPAAAAPGGQRKNWRGRDQADLRPCLIARVFGLATRVFVEGAPGGTRGLADSPKR